MWHLSGLRYFGSSRIHLYNLNPLDWNEHFPGIAFWSKQTSAAHYIAYFFCLVWLSQSRHRVNLTNDLHTFGNEVSVEPVPVEGKDFHLYKLVRWKLKWLPLPEVGVVTSVHYWEWIVHGQAYKYIVTKGFGCQMLQFSFLFLLFL